LKRDGLTCGLARQQGTGVGQVGVAAQAAWHLQLMPQLLHRATSTCSAASPQGVRLDTISVWISVY